MEVGERVDQNVDQNSHQGLHPFTFTTNLYTPPTITASCMPRQTYGQLWFPYK